MKKIRDNKLIALVMTALLITSLFTACGRRKADNGNVYKVFYPDKDYASIVSEERRVVSENSAVMLDSLMEILKETPADGKGNAPITSDIIPLSYSYENQKAVINFPKAYKELDRTREILIRASVVETLTQLDEVRMVSFLVEGRELRDNDGDLIGDMTADSFINNTGVELNSYARTNVTLYFTDIDGKSLKRYDEDVVYNTNMAMEKLAVETLISGPFNVNEQNAFPTLSPDTKLLSVTVKDRIAYANFDSSVREEPYNVTEETALYSIVDTLTALPGIDQVQISVEGSTEGVFMDHMRLDELYERNDEIIK